MIQNDPSLKHSFVVFEIRHHLQNCIGTLASVAGPHTDPHYVRIYIYIYIVYVCLHIYIYYIYIYIHNVNTLIIYHIYIKLYTIYCISRDSERERESEREPDIIYDNALHV